MRAWDFTTGEAYLSASPIVFSFSTDPRQKREFCEISTSKGRERQTFDDPAKGSEGAILGMGANAVVHRVQLHKVRIRVRVRVRLGLGLGLGLRLELGLGPGLADLRALGRVVEGLPLAALRG